MEKKFRFSEAKVRDLPLPEKGKRIHYADNHSRGLELIVRSSGTKTFYTNFWSPFFNKAIRVKIGNFPEASVSFARKQNNKNVEIILRGEHPNKEKIERRKQLVLSELFQLICENDFSDLKTTRQYKVNFNLHLRPFHKAYIDQISREDVINLHNKVAREVSPYTANRVLSLLSSLYNKAINHKIYVDNPCEKIKKKKELSRSRKLETSEIKRFFDAVITDENKNSRDVILLLLLTGARKSNVLSMRWKDINLDDCIWNIPETKNGMPQSVHLVDFAAQLLKDRKEEANNNEYVFQSEDSASGHLIDIRRAWKRILKNAELEDFRLHDLRRSFASFQINSGSNLNTVSKSLNHNSVQVTKIYARLDMNPIIESVESGINEFFKHVNKA